MAHAETSGSGSDQGGGGPRPLTLSPSRIHWRGAGSLPGPERAGQTNTQTYSGSDRLTHTVRPGSPAPETLPHQNSPAKTHGARDAQVPAHGCKAKPWNQIRTHGVSLPLFTEPHGSSGPGPAAPQVPKNGNDNSSLLFLSFQEHVEPTLSPSSFLCPPGKRTQQEPKDYSLLRIQGGRGCHFLHRGPAPCHTADGEGGQDVHKHTGSPRWKDTGTHVHVYAHSQNQRHACARRHARTCTAGTSTNVPV